MTNSVIFVILANFVMLENLCEFGGFGRIFFEFGNFVISATLVISVNFVISANFCEFSEFGNFCEFGNFYEFGNFCEFRIFGKM